MAKWCFDPKTKKPVRLLDEDAAKLVAQGGKYLSKSDAKRLLAAAEQPKG